MKDFKVYDAYRIKDSLWLPDVWLADGVLLLQGIVGAALVFYGCRKRFT